MARTKSAISLQTLHRIIADAAAAHTVEAQVESLVEDVCEEMLVAVCSLYQRFDNDVLRLVANRGLAPDSVGKLALPVGVGLVGRIAQTNVPVNLTNASDHPDFQFFPESGEAQYPVFLGVPIVHLGATNGVLVVQDVAGRSFSADEEAFLVTIAAQLAPILLRFAARSGVVQRNYTGIAAAPGKAIGSLQLVLSAQTLQLVEEPGATDAQAELEALAQAVEKATKDLDLAKTQLASSVADEVLELFDFYRTMLASDHLIAGAEQRIVAGASAFSAVRDTVDEYVKAFDAIQDDYLRARGEDVRGVGSRLLAHVLDPALVASTRGDKVILLGSHVSIADIATYPPGDVVGVICLSGSALSHTAVLARALGIPAVFGTGPVDHITHGMPTVVDGDLGLVVFEPSNSVISGYRSLIEQERAFDQELLKDKHLPAISKDGVRVQLLANSGLLADATPGKQRGAEGVGLFRSEIPFLERSAFPSEDEQYRTYRQLLELYHPLPVTMRTLDVGGDKPLPYLPLAEENPALGWRGVRFTLDNPPVLVAQLRAMLRANLGLGNLRLLLPMVSRVAEVARVRAIVADIVVELGGDERVMPPFGIMVEVPGVVPLLTHMEGLIDFVSVGTNDLTQYLLAVDRSNMRVAALYDPLHPSVLSTLDTIFRVTRRLPKGASICGEMASDPVAATILFGMGYRSLSMSAFALPRIKAVIRGLSSTRARRISNAALKLGSPEEIRALLVTELTDMGLAGMLDTRTRGAASPTP